ncbi:hypothetical protein [Rhizobium sp. LC145]|uniref:hypothetical protein n=1 Tax=Rhizobium sp. LC145 TaxID=1120688 RepID=UPI00062A3C99|nr:hypothetical protein [Rhizobium sp. LC145]KKX28243.1 hypothetical protein YH62_19335 [Rhizobium sp. LC145]TKT58339.1 hypothetical protein FDR95_12080 [Rhizobiaceae bacterium LC148]
MSGTVLDRDQEKRVLEKLRGILDRTQGDQWMVEAAPGEMHLVARRATGESTRILTLHAADALVDEIDLVCGALDHLRMFIGFFDRAAAKVRQLGAEVERQTARKREANLGFQAKKLCENAAFRRFLELKGPGGPVHDAQAADTRLKGLLAISSKSELNVDERAGTAFRALRADFYAWERGGR